jgi:predicted GIY-YIG superfamily endonuclease
MWQFFTKKYKIEFLSIIIVRNCVMSRTTTSIYVLRLLNEKYYVGKSTNIQNRIMNHFSNQGACWTKKYKPLEVVEIMKNADPFDEDKKVKQYMMKYGIDSVRGGSYSRIKLTTCEINFIKRELRTASDRCFKCGENNHFENMCGKNNLND